MHLQLSGFIIQLPALWVYNSACVSHLLMVLSVERWTEPIDRNPGKSRISQADCTPIPQLFAPQESLKENKGRRSEWELEKPQQCPHVPSAFAVWWHWSWMRVSVPLVQGSVCLHLYLGLVSSWLPGEAEELIQLLLTLEMEASSFSTGLCPVLLGAPLKSAGWGGFTENRILEWPGRDLKDLDTTTFKGFFFSVWLTYFDCFEFKSHDLQPFALCINGNSVLRAAGRSQLQCFTK